MKLQSQILTGSEDFAANRAAHEAALAEIREAADWAAAGGGAGTPRGARQDAAPAAGGQSARP